MLALTAQARLLLGAWFPNHQPSWVKLTLAGATEALRWGCNDLGGTLMEESITSAAGALGGTAQSPEALRRAAAVFAAPRARAHHPLHRCAGVRLSPPRFSPSVPLAVHGPQHGCVAAGACSLAAVGASQVGERSRSAHARYRAAAELRRAADPTGTGPLAAAAGAQTLQSAIGARNGVSGGSFGAPMAMQGPTSCLPPLHRPQCRPMAYAWTI